MSLQVGDVLLEKYRIERMLGEGGFGSVFAALDINLGRRVAIKELRPELTNNPEVLERFTREARSIAQLNNPHIVTLLDWEESGDHKYMVLEYMDGGSLADLLTKRGKLTTSESASIAKDVCDGLAAAHQKGIYHRDIKPANIMLSQDGQIVKISDFGIAHVPSPVSGVADTTHAKGGAGTPWYMSPEQARGETVDQRTDLYSLGVVLYEMVSGYAYLDFSSDLLRDVAKVKNTPPRQMPAAVPANFRQVILRALTKNPNERFQSANEMASALQGFIKPGAGIAIPKTKTRPLPPSSLPETQNTKIAPPLIGGGIAMIVIIIGILAVVLFTPQLPAPTATPKEVAVATTTRTITPAATATSTQDIGTTIALAAQATIAFKATLDAQVNATLTKLAPTITPTGMPTPIPSPTSTATPTITPSPTATRQLVPIRLLSPTQNQLFNNEKYPPVLEWRAASNQPLTGKEYYRVQVYRPGQLICNDYTRDTIYALPPSDTLPCKPGMWRFNTGDYSWRVSLVERVDENPEHDKEILNSEGWLFRWLK